MHEGRLGSAIRMVRQRRRWTQADLGARAGVSKSTISRIERGHVRSLSVATIQEVAGELDIRVDLVPRWRSGDLDRMLNRRHSNLHELVARWFGEMVPDWVLAPEVSYSIYGERGVIDILAWHPGRRALMIIELKTDIVDVNDLVGAADRRKRLARTIVADRGWDPASVSVWVIVAPSRTNRRRIAAHEAMLRAAFPADGRTIRAWLRNPVESLAALSIWPNSHAGKLGPGVSPVRRVRPARNS
ncbi:MAG TPA: helix-turn-helix transcriptional regulator [Candidatus Limnocylindrales bacterium]|nr:helix-turn-helix transcriptional regulator [Candidatus Limnocylindrales bacterium]